MSPIVYIVFIVLGLILVIFSFRAKKKAKAAQEWPTIPGVILSSRVDEHVSRDSDGDRNTTYKPVVAYQYAIMGQEYTGSRISFGANTFSRRKCEEIIAGYPVGQPVNVHYNPDKPQDAVLETVEKGGTVSLVIGIVFLGIGLVMALFSFLG